MALTGPTIVGLVADTIIPGEDYIKKGLGLSLVTLPPISFYYGFGRVAPYFIKKEKSLRNLQTQ